MKIKWIIMVLMVMAMTTPAYAVSNSACITSNTLEINTTINGDIINEQKNCP